VARSTIKARADKQRFRGLGKSYVKYMGRHLHRVLAEQKLGRPLRLGEVVHHVDGNHRNNSLDNLVVITQAKHAGDHSRKNRRCSVPECGRKHAARGFCQKHWKRWKKGTQIEGGAMMGD